jgi:hypothetical protein
VRRSIAKKMSAEMERLRQDVRDACDVGDVQRCLACKRLGLRRQYVCAFCGDDPTVSEEKKS